MKKIILILIAIITITIGCSKYERTVKKIYGEYTLKTYTVNGIDSMSLYKDSLGLFFNFYNNDEYSSNVLFISGPRSDGKENHIICTWRLINKYNVLKICTAYGSSGTGPFGYMKTPEWEFLSLKYDIKMKTNYNGKEYLVVLE